MIYTELAEFYFFRVFPELFGGSSFVLELVIWLENRLLDGKDFLLSVIGSFFISTLALSI
jgi:hypothetical protein